MNSPEGRGHVMGIAGEVKLSIIIVGWNSSDYLEGCLRSICERPPSCRYEVIYVDNGSEDGSVGRVKRRFPRVRIFDNAQNLGFAKANNRGIQVARGEYVLLLNPDTVILDRFFDALLTFMDRHPEAAAASGKCLYPDGRVQWAVADFPTSWQLFCAMMRRHRMWGRLFRSDHKHGEVDAVRKQDYAYGACCIVRRAVINEVGMMDEAMFIFAEDVEWGTRMKKAGWEVYYVPHAQLIHHAGTSTTKRDPKRLYVQGIISHRYVIHKYGGFIERTCLNLFILVDIVGKGLETSIYALLGRENGDPVYRGPADVVDVFRQVFFQQPR